MVSNKSDITRKVIEEHEELNQNIGELKIILLEKASTKNFPDWRIQLIGKLQDFKQKLTSHFEFEEQGGFMTEVIDEAPQFLNQVKELEIEHKQILANLDGVVKDFKKLGVKDDLELQDIFKPKFPES